MKNRYSLLAIVLPLAIGISTSSATTIFNDTFTDGGRTNGADAQDVAWYETTTAVNSSILTSGGSLLTGNTLTVDGANFQGITAPFSMTNLSLGQTLTVTLDFRLISTQNLGNGIRIGFANSASNPYTADGNPDSGTVAALSHFGYFAGVGIGTDNSLSVQQDAGADTTSGFSNGSGIGGIGTSSTAQGFDNGVNQSILFSITRTAAGASLTSQVFGAVGSTGTPVTQVLDQVDTTSPYFSFDYLSVRIGNNNAIDYNIDNVHVTLIPEPSAALLGGLGLLALLRRRRA